jgi:hypothetical protein
MQRIGIVLMVAPVILGAMLVVPLNTGSASAAADLSSSYFPLAPKNFWVYTVSKEEGPVGEEVVAVLSSVMIDGKEVFLSNNYGFGVSDEAIEFFTDDQGRTCEHKKGKVAPWYPWTDAGLVILPLFGPEDCMRGSSGIMYHVEEITVPAGTFHDGFMVTYDRIPCFDLGLVSEVFMSGVGLVERKVLTFAGVRTWALAYAYIDGKWVGFSAAGRPLPVETTWGRIKASFVE